MDKSLMTKPEYRLYLFVKVFNEGHYIWGICKRFSSICGISHTTAHGSLKKLEKLGWVKNYAYGCWSPTPKGMKVFKNIQKTFDIEKQPE